MAPVNGEAGCYPFRGIEKINLQVPMRALTRILFLVKELLLPLLSNRVIW